MTVNQTLATKSTTTKTISCSRGSSVSKASWIKVPQKRGSTELTRVRFPVMASEVGKIVAVLSMRQI